MSIDDKIIHGNYYSSVCTHCENLHNEVLHTCEAFSLPDKIPDKIWNGEDKHTSPVNGDLGVMYTPVTDETLRQRATS